MERNIKFLLGEELNVHVAEDESVIVFIRYLCFIRYLS